MKQPTSFFLHIFMRYMKSFRINIYDQLIELMESRQQKESREKLKGENYEEFINNNFERIVDAFELNGYVVENREDIDTYPRWLKRNRQVHWGERSTLLISDKPTPQQVYIGGKPIKDERTGKTKIRTYKKRYYLFHKDQTRKEAPVKTYKIPTT